MNFVSLYALSLSVIQIGEQPDALSTFRVLNSRNLSYDEVNVQLGIRLAHRLQVLASIPEDAVPRHTENTLSVSERFVQISYRERARVGYIRGRGELFVIGITPPSQNRQPNLDEAQCLSRSQEYYRLAGGTLPLALERSYFENGEFSHPQYVHAVYKFTAPGTPWKFEDGVETIIDRTYGTPMHMWIGHPPAFEVPGTVVPKTSALAAAASVAAQFTGWPEVMPAADDPKFRIPSFADLPNRMRAVEHRRARERKAALFYEVTVRNGGVQVEREQDRPFIWVHIDAESGEPIAIFPAYQRLGGHSAPKARDFSWSGKTWRSGKVSGTVRPSSLTPPANGKSVSFTSGLTHVFAKFDLKSRLVWTVSQGKTTAGVPDSALLKALSKAKAIPSFPMKKGQPKADPLRKP